MISRATPWRRTTARDLLEQLDPNALLLMRSDENYTSVEYAQVVEGVRPDVVALDVEQLKMPSVVEAVRRRHPDVVLPWAAYDGGRRTSLNALVEANIASRPIYYVGTMAEKGFPGRFGTQRAGLVTKISPSVAEGGGYGLLATRPDLVEALHFPDSTYPDTTWESVIASHYGVAASDLAFALQSAQSTDHSTIEKYYRLAMSLDPTQPSNYKNLGVLLNDTGGDPKEIGRLWRTFLELAPNDPDADKIRAVLERSARRISVTEHQIPVLIDRDPSGAWTVPSGTAKAPFDRVMLRDHRATGAGLCSHDHSGERGPVRAPGPRSVPMKRQ